MKTILAFLLICAVPLLAAEPATSVLEDPATALLIIDIQAFYFPDGALPLHAPEAASAQASRLLEAFRKHERTIVHVGHKARAGAEFHPDVMPLPGEPIVMKSEVNAFLGTDLLGILQEAGIERLVICGMQTHMCVEGAVRAAADAGFKCLVVEDACATRDLDRDGQVLKADWVHQTTLATLEGAYADVIKTEALLSK